MVWELVRNGNSQTHPDLLSVVRLCPLSIAAVTVLIGTAVTIHSDPGDQVT